MLKNVRPGAQDRKDRTPEPLTQQEFNDDTDPVDELCVSPEQLKTEALRREDQRHWGKFYSVKDRYSGYCRLPKTL